MIVVFGSLNIDMVLPVVRMPRPGETVLCPNYQLIPGGKGANQAVAATKAGANTTLYGKVGNDPFGVLILDALNGANVDTLGVATIDHPTGCAAINVDRDGENMITVASGANQQAKACDVPDDVLTKNTTLLLQMETPSAENWELIKRARKNGVRTILNLAPAFPIPKNILTCLSILVLNQIEAMFLALHLKYEASSPSVVAQRIATNFKITCVVTLGSEGALAATPDQTWIVEAMDIQAIDTTAAGDAFVGVLAASLDAGLELPTALRRASVASGLACLTSGAQSSLPDAAQINAAIHRVPPARTL